MYFSLHQKGAGHGHNLVKELSLGRVKNLSISDLWKTLSSQILSPSRKRIATFLSRKKGRDTDQ